jgi:anti-sigma factor RsiW
MGHLKETTLALHASGDLGWFAAWKAERHLAGCERCRAEVESFREMRESLPEIAELPDVQWNRLAAEMRANIRLGIAAGECVREADAAEIEPSPLFNTARAVLAFAGVFTLVVTGLVLQGPAPRIALAAEPTAQATANGIGMRAGNQGFELMHDGAQSVINTVSTQGIGARYTDPQTGLVTMTKVYVE